MKANLSILFFCVIIAFAAACKKSGGGGGGPTPPVTQVPTVSGISPDNGGKGTLVTITGNNFGTDASKVTVFFNGIPAVINSVSNTQIVAVVPAKSYSGIVKVIVSAQTVNGPLFKYNVTATVSTLAGNGKGGYVDGTGANAQFAHPLGVTVDSSGNVYVADLSNACIRKITAAGVVTTVAGNPATVGYVDGGVNVAAFGSPQSISWDPSSNALYVADISNNRIRKITLTGTVTVSTYAGTHTQDFLDGNIATALFYTPGFLTNDAAGNVYVADLNNYRIRKISTAGIVSTVAGNGTSLTNDGAATGATIAFPNGLTVDANGVIYIGETTNNMLRKLSGGNISTLAGGNTNQDYADGTGTAAKFAEPAGVAVDKQGNIYIVDRGNRCIRMSTPAGVVTTIVGTAGGFGFKDGVGGAASFASPLGLTIDSQGNLYVADETNHAIRKIVIE